MNATSVPLWRPALGLSLLSLLLFGSAYPLCVVGLSQHLVPEAANGGLLYRNGKVVGSRWVGQNFVSPQWMIGRPSAAGDDPLAASGSNLGTGHPALAKRIQDELQVIAERDARVSGIPADAVEASGSGLDPDISPQWAALQFPRLAVQHGVSESYIAALVAPCSTAASVLGPARVNVLCVNMALAALPVMPLPSTRDGRAAAPGK